MKNNNDASSILVSIKNYLDIHKDDKLAANMLAIFFDTFDSSTYEMQYFTFHEFEYSVTASKYRIDNKIPNDVVKNNILNLVSRVLDPARIALGKPIYISSGYRSQALNSCVGGVPASRHLIGLAADVSCIDMKRLFDILVNLPHRELIDHGSYIHVAL